MFVNSSLVPIQPALSRSGFGAFIGESLAGKAAIRARDLRATPDSNVAAALRPRHREHVLDRGVILVAAAGERVGAGGVEAAVEKKRSSM